METLGFAGLLLLLVAYFQSVWGVVKQDSMWTPFLNLVGAALMAFYAGYMEAWLFVALEVVWAVSSLAVLIHRSA
jgi:hypothetical protein